MASGRTWTRLDSGQGMFDCNGGMETGSGCFGQKREHMQRPQGRNKRVRNLYKVWYDHRKERDMERKSARGQVGTLVFTSRAISGFKQGMPPDQVAISCEGQCQLPRGTETPRRQEIQFCDLAHQLPRPGLKETYGGSYFIAAHP